MHKFSTRFCAVLGLAAALISTSHAQAPYPSKPIRLVAPLPAGTATDIAARTLAKQMAADLGQPVIVENKAGADGAIAALDVIRAAPDGYTLLFATNSVGAAVPTMRKSPPYDPLVDFTPISRLGTYQHFLLVNPNVPAKTLAEFVAYARANPSTLNYGSGATFAMIATEQLMDRAKIKMLSVAYKGEPAALLDLVGGRVHFMFATQTTALPLVKDGRVRALAVTNSTRIAEQPDVPTLAEAGFPDFPHLSWASIVGPANMPRNVVDVLNREVRAAVEKPELKQELLSRAFEVKGSTPEELTAFFKEQLSTWGKAVVELGLQSD